MLDERAPSPPALTADYPHKVLLVDDDSHARRLLGTSLRRAGFDVVAAAGGAEALGAIESSLPAVLVLDLAMPGLDGAEVCRRLRASDRTALSRLPIIMLTGHTGEADEIACLSAGANDYVTKPVNRDILVARIETQLRLSALNDELDRTANHAIASCSSLVVANKARTEQAEARTEQAETHMEQAKSRAEMAETRAENAEIRTGQAEMRTEQAETRTEQAKSRAEWAETRAENAELLTGQAGKTDPLVVQRDIHQRQGLSTQPLKNIPVDEIAVQKSPLKQLTSRQREILKLIAEGQNTKQIAGILNVSPKTIEYHRIKLMDCLNIHDVPHLVRFALRVGLIPLES